MQNYFLANHRELNNSKETFYQELNTELRCKFYHYNFQVEPYFKSREQPLSLNNIGLKFLKINPQILENEKWVSDKTWVWDREKIETISKICTKVANRFGFEFVKLNSNFDNHPLFVIRVARDI